MKYPVSAMYTALLSLLFACGGETKPGAASDDHQAAPEVARIAQGRAAANESKLATPSKPSDTDRVADSTVDEATLMATAEKVMGAIESVANAIAEAAGDCKKMSAAVAKAITDHAATFAEGRKMQGKGGPELEAKLQAKFQARLNKLLPKLDLGACKNDPELMKLMTEMLK